MASRSRTLCIFAAALALLYLLALAAGLWSGFGQLRDPLSGVLLLPLGLAWNLLLQRRRPEAALPALGLRAPLVNLALRVLLCRRRRAGR